MIDHQGDCGLQCRGCWAETVALLESWTSVKTRLLTFEHIVKAIRAASAGVVPPIIRVSAISSMALFCACTEAEVSKIIM